MTTQLTSNCGVTIRWSFLIISICVAGCSSSKTAKHNEFGPTFQERMSAANKAMKNGNFAMRSSFEQKIPKGTTDKTYNAPGYKAKDATGMKQFSGTDSAHHTKDFAGASKTNPIGDKVTPETKAQNKLATQMFRTPDGHFDTKSIVDDKKVFSQGGDTFKTSENQIGTKEIEKNKKPVILGPEKPAYSEDDVKRLLNKG